MMDKNELRMLFDREMRREVTPPGFRREESEQVIRHVSLHSDEHGFVIYSNVTLANAREIIAGEKKRFSDIKQGFEWKVYSYDEPNLLNLLQEEGFKKGEKEALMAIELTQDHSLLKHDTSNVKEITDEDGIKAIMKLEETIWNEPFKDLGERLWRDFTETNTLRLYGIYEGEELVSAAWMYLEGENFSSMWGGSTLKEHRNKGHYTALLAARAKKAVEMGHPILMVDASPMSEPILKKCGFERLGYSYGMTFPGGDNK
ncbi:GNAT family N-acetyltransferase [Guptibacillus algicola]|uniref:GNAT family N-acetyltransferase n=1 Tax=Guptibacillus algicola TaxID=225844 RepID=UPI001CD2EF18|nr:GNAT family N-acetyltransferase [Alkalihalobacillus algicola]MCA0988468.1 GNAT family N-acetyltransferase [Alkalihalobacillus algicola]